VVLDEEGSRTIGDYDGYGRIRTKGGGELDVVEGGSGEPEMWHHRCWLLAGRPNYTGRSRSAEDQGMPNCDTEEPKTADDLPKLRALAETKRQEEQEKIRKANEKYVAELKAEGKEVPKWLKQYDTGAPVLKLVKADGTQVAPAPKPAAKVDAVTEEFWTEVAAIGWSKKAKLDPAKVKRKLMEKWTPEKAELMLKTFMALEHALYDKLDKEVEGLGDDGFGDLLAHIIGLGREEFHATLNDPKRAKRRAERGDFTESFSYCLPTASEYKYLTPAFYAEWAERDIAELRDEDGPRFSPSVRKDFAYVIKQLQLVADEKPLEFLAQEADIRSAVDRLTKTTSINPWAVTNLLHDIRNYLA
jgi:hypothetical protein